MSAVFRTTLVAIASCAIVACGSGGNGATTTSSSGGTTGGTGLPGFDGGSPCADGGDCASTSCLGGRCCNDACPMADPGCAATGCDETGMCIYPGPSLSCGGPSCQGLTSLSQRICDGNGDCVLGTPNPCPTNYACNATTSQCNQLCQTDVDCDVTIAFCDPTNACVPKLPPGSPCLTDSACASRTCLGGYCCTDQFCPIAVDTNCAANACSSGAGACRYPVCSGGLGCGTQGGTSCLSHCSSGADCVPGLSCDPLYGVCCTDLSPGMDFYVDGFAGSDNGCCGSSTAPCLTLNRAMQRLSTSGPQGTVGATIHAFNGDGSLDWTAPERWPVHLGLGVTLIAPNLYFDSDNPGDNLFEVYGYSPTDAAPVTIEGDPTTNGIFIHLGFLFGAAANPPNAGVSVDDSHALALPLTISNAWIFGINSAINIGAGASVTVGPMPVTIGSNGGQRQPPVAGTGITCQGLPGKPAELSDQGAQALRIDCGSVAIAAKSNCTIALLHSPALGLNAYQHANVSCFQTTGLLVSGGASVFFGAVSEPGSIRWYSGNGVDVSASDAGFPSVNVSADLSYDNNGASIAGGYVSATGSSFASNSNAGASVSGGFLATTGSSFSGNYGYGLLVTGGGADLGGDGGPATALYCNGIGDVVNAGLGTVGLAKVLWDNWSSDAGSPTVWRCPDAGATSGFCSCVSGNCADAGGAYPGYPPAGLDALYFDYIPVFPFDFSGGQQVSGACP